MINVVCAVIVKDKKILVTQRSATMSLPLRWEFPGGKMEDGETEEACIKREILEELNIEINIIRKLTPVAYDYENIQINLIPFLVEYRQGDIVLLEHNKFLLATTEDLLQLDWAPADLPILNELLTIEI